MKREKIDDEPFVNESVLAAANNVFNFEKFKKQQEDAIREFKENKNAEITARKIRDKYRKMRKKRIISKLQKEETFESFSFPLKKVKDKLIKLHK